MKLLFILHGWPPDSIGGTEIYARRLAKRLASGNNTRVFCREADPKRPDYEIRTDMDDGIEVTKVNYSLKDVKNFSETYSNKEIARIFNAYLDSIDVPDIVHIHHLGGLGHLLPDSLDKRAIPYVITLHDFALTCPRGQRIRDSYSICDKLAVNDCVECLKPQCKGAMFGIFGKSYRYFLKQREGRRLIEEFWRSSEKIANNAKALIAPSRHHARIMEADGFAAAKIHVMPYGYDIESFAAARRAEIGLARKFGYLGSIIPSKGVHVLIESFRKLKKDFPELDVELHIHGPAPVYHGNSKYFEKLKDRSRGLPVTFHGPYNPESAGAVLSNLDAVVVPSLWWESHGMVVREAKLVGLPVIVSAHGAVCEAVQDGVNGLLFRPGNALHLRDKMHILAVTPGLADALGKGPMDILPIEKDAKAHIELYTKLLEK